MSRISILIPTINRADLLLNSLLTLADQTEYFEKLLIVDNGHQRFRIPSELSGKIGIIESKNNLGVSGSWNLGITELFKADDFVTHVLVLNDDISLGSTQLQDIIEVLDANPEKWMFVGPYYWSVYAISREGAKAMEFKPEQYFDERFYPAYFEDNDFHWRMRLIDESRYLGGVSAFSPEKYINSGSLEKDPSLNKTFDQNKRYYISKWGGAPGRERYRTPFNL